LRILALVDAARADPAVRTTAVLVRARSHLDSLVALIRRTRPALRFQAVEVDSLGDRPWIADLVMLTRALLQRADRVNWLAVLRSPLVGLTLADLCALAEDDKRATVWSLLADTARVATLSEDGRACSEGRRRFFRNLRGTGAVADCALG
jgi:ATP-dependent exoDNAse (exonuclease V) beta subunit